MIAPWAGARSTAWLPQPPAIALGEADALLDDRVEDRADDVERAVDVRPGVEDEDPHAALGRDLDRVVLVLVGDAVEDDEVGRRARLRSPSRSRPARFCAPRYHSLWTRATSSSTLGRPPFGLDDDHPEHAVGDVVQRRGRAAVVHPDAGVVGGEGVGERLARLRSRPSGGSSRSGWRGSRSSGSSRPGW